MRSRRVSLLGPGLAGVGCVLVIAVVPSRAWAQCDPVACAAMDTTSICATTTHSCVTAKIGDVCRASTSWALAGTKCETDNNACTDDTCNGTGTCVHAPVAQGAACPDDGNACTIDTCNSTGSCTHPPYANGTACASDGNPCTTDACNGAGTCAHTNPTSGTVCGTVCIPPGTCCNSPNSCTGGRVCSGVGGSCGCASGTFDCNGSCIANCTGGKVCAPTGASCACPTGTYDCGGTCIASATCCNNPNNCNSIANGTGVCSALGGSCMLTCNTNYVPCGNACIAKGTCCTAGDCTAPANASPLCSGPGGTCSWTCNSPLYKVCGGGCIMTSSCCNSTDCTTPKNSCFKTPGTCAAGSCSYAFNDGIACNADNDACTPNDKCTSGVCNADMANRVKCTQRDCHTTPMCNKSTGNCDDAAVANGTACGGNGCSATAGTCTTGTCSSPPKSCTSLDSDCAVGICDAAGPVGAPCGTTNKLNGTACALADLCQLTTACSGGVCVGTPKLCTPSSPCRIASCDPGTGNCVESLAPASSACDSSNTCVQNATCDSTGACVGQPVPDDSPCSLDSCTTLSACVSGSCVCIQSVDLAGNFSTGDDMGANVDQPGKKSGCSAAGAFDRTAGEPGTLALVLLGVALASLRGFRRRRA